MKSNLATSRDIRRVCPDCKAALRPKLAVPGEDTSSLMLWTCTSCSYIIFDASVRRAYKTCSPSDAFSIFHYAVAVKSYQERMELYKKYLRVGGKGK